MQVDLIPLLAEAFAFNRKIHKDIDRLYSKKKYEFYKSAKKSKYYNHTIMVEGSIRRDMYARKSLGLFEYLRQHPGDNQVVDELNKIFKKGWAKAYSHAKNNKEIDLEKYLERLSDHYKTEDHLNTEVAVLVFLCLNTGTEIKPEVFQDEILRILHMRIQYGINDNPERFSYKIFPNETRNHVKTLKARIWENYGKINSLMTIMKITDPDLKRWSESMFLLFDPDRISATSLFNDVKLTEKDVNEILAAYFLYAKNKNKNKAAKYLIWGLILKGMIKAYKQVKEFYFENNQETMFFEMQRQDEEIKRLEEQNTLLTAQVEKLSGKVEGIKNEESQKHQEHIRKLETDVEALTKELAEQRAKDKELNALREFVFALESPPAPEPEDAQVDLSGINGAVFGGHEQWRKKLQEHLPHFVFVATEKFDPNILNKADAIFLVPEHMGHALYYRVIAEVQRRAGLAVSYLKHTNIELALQSIRNAIKKSKEE